ncbi:MAG: stage III sporulation protein AD [Lachnospiraceae bacterium]|nr:stage III sporulation protein AD [Lachnospiraceae bacterium]
MIKIVIIGLMAVLLALSLKQERTGFAMLVILAASILILGFSTTKMQGVLQVVQKLEDVFQEDAVYVQILLKMLGITYIAEFGSGLCRDAGYGAVGGQIEFYGKLMLLAVSMPIIENLVEVITGIGV